jgi:Co/Zn/Cd efflux system component
VLGRIPINYANVEALVERLQGEAASRPRAMVMSGSAGLAVAVVAYRLLRKPEHEEGS